MRIIENGQVRDYYIQIDNPSNGYATVWFEANISSQSSTNERSRPSDEYFSPWLSWYYFEGDEMTVIDNNNNYNGTVANQATRAIVPSASTELGNALEFDGRDDYAYIQGQSLSTTDIGMKLLKDNSHLYTARDVFMGLKIHAKRLTSEAIVWIKDFLTVAKERIENELGVEVIWNHFRCPSQ